MKVWQYLPERNNSLEDWYYIFKIEYQDTRTEKRKRINGEFVILSEPSQCFTEKVVYERILD
jgi:hypothetical protein